MKTLKDSLIYVCIIFIFSCNPCDDCNINIEDINKIRENISSNINIEEYSKIELNILYDILTTSDISLLKEYRFKSIEYFKNHEVEVYTFKNSKFEGLKDKSKTFCSSYFFFSENLAYLNEISSYEGYNECRVSKKIINDNWILIIQEQNCEK